MNVSHRYKLIWWATARCASRYTTQFIAPLEFYNYDSPNAKFKALFFSDVVFQPSTDEYISFSHKTTIPTGMEDYKVIANIRNPYDRFYSNYRLQELEYLRGELGRMPSDSDVVNSFQNWAPKRFAFLESTNYDVIYDKHELTNIDRIDYLIRYESLVEDILKIPHISDLYASNAVYKKWVDDVLSNTEPYGGYRGALPYSTQKFTDVYTEEIADKVYSIYKLQFDAFGYDKNSWKK